MTAREALGAFTLHELIADPLRIPSVPTTILTRLYAQSALAVGMPDLQDTTREYLQQVRRDIGRTLDARRYNDRHQEQPATAQDAPGDAQTADASQPAQSRDERIGEILRSLIHLAGQPPDRPDGGTKVRRPTPPTQPTPPSMAVDPVAF